MAKQRETERFCKQCGKKYIGTKPHCSEECKRKYRSAGVQAWRKEQYKIRDEKKAIELLTSLGYTITKEEK